MAATPSDLCHHKPQLIVWQPKYYDTAVEARHQHPLTLLGDAAGLAVEDLVVVAKHLHAGEPPAVVAHASGQDADQGALARSGVSEDAQPVVIAIVIGYRCRLSEIVVVIDSSYRITISDNVILYDYRKSLSDIVIEYDYRTSLSDIVVGYRHRISLSDVDLGIIPD